MVGSQFMKHPSTALGIIALAVSYYLAGRLGLLFAIAPGSAGPVWLPAGVALAAILVMGYRVWPGILLGSMALTVTDAFHTGSNLMSSHFYIAPVVIGLGVSLRSLAGSWLIHRWLRPPFLLEKPKDIALFMILGGPVSCMIAPTIGCATLWIMGGIQSDALMFRWITWWMGDTLGVLMTAPPLVLLCSANQTVTHYRKVALATSSITSLCITAFLFSNTLQRALLDAMPVWELWGELSGEALLAGFMNALVLLMTGRADVAHRQIAEQNKALQFQQEQWRLIVDGTVDGIWDWPDSTKDEVYWSPRWKAMLGYQDHEIQGSKLKLRELLHPDDVVICAEAIRACLAEEKPFDIEYRLRKKSGEYGWFHGKGVLSRNGDKLRMTGTIMDVSERKFADSIRERLIKQLTDANEQLEQFAYVASHDLREPLRTIVSFSDLLIKEYGEALHPEAKEYASISRRAAKKMESMVADLLEYGRMGHEAVRMTQINCNVKLHAAKEALEEAIRSTDASIQSERLPVITGNPVRFSRLLQNLIGNALKYHRQGESPQIKIWAEEKSDHWLFAVSDRGIGIKPEYLEVIFMPFKRLHSDREYTGTGIGLAICKKIVESAGGTIWVESEYGKGSTFFFTVPKHAESLESIAG